MFASSLSLVWVGKKQWEYFGHSHKWNYPLNLFFGTVNMAVCLQDIPTVIK